MYEEKKQVAIFRERAVEGQTYTLTEKKEDSEPKV